MVEREGLKHYFNNQINKITGGVQWIYFNERLHSTEANVNTVYGHIL